MADVELKEGQTVKTSEGRQGVIRYIGELHIAEGEWLGLELPEATGKNDGAVKGERYFNCKPGHGIFVRKEVVEIVRQAQAQTTARPNGSATVSHVGTRPRLTGGISADVARRRQSLMSNGSGSATGSRLSMRSPTKSPVKPASTSASSTTSTPRASTPSTTAKASDSSNKSRLSMSGRPSLGPSSTGARSSTHALRPSIGGSSSLRTTTAPRSTALPARSTLSGTIVPQHAKSTSGQEKLATKITAGSDQEARAESVRSPTIHEEAKESDNHQELPTIDENLHQPDRDGHIEQLQKTGSPRAITNVKRTTSASAPASKTGTVGVVESRIAQHRETEQLKAKIRTLEKKRQEDRDKLKQVETLQNDKDRFEGIIQALQKKLRANQQELIELRNKCKEAEARADAVPERSGEHESEMELATLDKEMAEERAEGFQKELEELKAKHEELELETEILREENAELASTMSPEEKANAGWLQMERERERLRDALIQLRDMSQENESNLRAEIDELREHLDELEKTAGMYVDAAEKLTHAEETNKHLMGQLEAVETNDEVVEAMEVQREQHLNSIERLRNQIQDLEEHIQVTDELELFHVDEEKRLHAQLYESEALLSESHRRSLEQDRIIEDLEYTLTKFRDVVQGLQSDIDELRRSRDISELQASEMSFKSRAMLDLNLRLQNNAAKTQTKTIDTELNRVQAELATKHVNILSLFTVETFELEKKPVLVLLCFSRVKSKASLVAKMLAERLRERAHLSSGEEVFSTFEIMERMEWMSEACLRLERFMTSCDTQGFAACSSALAELEPVERAVTAWLEALRRDESASNDPDHLKRMKEVLADLSEKLLTESTETKAAELIAQTEMVGSYAESLAGQLTAMAKLVQSKLGPPKSEVEESLVFDKRMDQLATKARTIKYLSNKTVQQLTELYNSSLCLDEISWLRFEEAEQEAEFLARQVRVIGFAVAEELSKFDMEDAFSYTSIPKTMMSILQQSAESNGSLGDDPFTFLSHRFTSLQSLVDDLQSKSSDLDSTTEFVSRLAPWIVRAKEIKSTKYISSDVQDELTRLERRNIELGSKIAEREKFIEEMSMRVEIAEKRFRESKEKDHKDKALQEELDTLRSEKRNNDKSISDLNAELASAHAAVETTQSELENLRSAASGQALTAAATAGSVGPGGKVDESLIEQYELEATLLQAQISSLQAAIRYLREENRNLRIPISEVLINSAKHSWLDANIPRRKPTPKETRQATLEREGADVWAELIDVAKTVKPLRLGSAAATDPQRQRPSEKSTTSSSWQPTLQSTRYLALKQREELERWDARREDFVNKAKVATSGARKTKAPTNVGRIGVPRVDAGNLVGRGGGLRVGGEAGIVKRDDGPEGGEVGSVRIVDL